MSFNYHRQQAQEEGAAFGLWWRFMVFIALPVIAAVSVTGCLMSN